MGVPAWTSAVVALTLLVSGAAIASDDVRQRDGVDVREQGRCVPTGTWRLRVQGDDDGLRVESVMRVARPRGERRRRWSVVVVHERRTVLRASLPPGSNGTLRMSVRVNGFDGTNAVTVRAYGPRGRSCVASVVAVLPVDG